MSPSPLLMSNSFKHASAVEADVFMHTVPDFDPEKHIVFNNSPDTLTLQDIGLNNVGVSPIAVTHPFHLFSAEAIQIMRSEIFKPQVMQHYAFTSNLAPAQLRGYARDHAPFTYAAWKHPKTISIVSRLAGIDLVPWGDYEIAHTNLSVRIEEQVNADQDTVEQQRHIHADEGIDVTVSQNDTSIIGWHKDSYPFVCVLMMSDCTDMVGGETALRKGNGEVLRLRGPTEGCAIILQGRHVVHQALRAFGAKERITAVTSFRPRSPFVEDHTVLTTVRPVSDLNELYHDYVDYRLDIMTQRIQREREDLQARRKVGKTFDTISHKGFLAKLVAFLQHNDQELVEEDQVHKGSIDMVDIPNFVVNGNNVSSMNHSSKRSVAPPNLDSQGL